MALVYQKFITRSMVQEHPNDLFVFGDNVLRTGLGGQAKEMRGEPNAVGIITKRFPSNTPDSFLNQGDFLNWFNLTARDRIRLLDHVYLGGNVVWPSDGIGTGLADLKNKAPDIMRAIKDFENMLIDLST